MPMLPTLILILIPILTKTQLPTTMTRDATTRHPFALTQAGRVHTRGRSVPVVARPALDLQAIALPVLPTLRVLPLLPLLRVPMLMLVLSLVLETGHAAAADFSLLPPTLSHAGIPGEFRESRMSARSTLTLQPGFSWSTTTGLTGTRYGQGVPMLSDSLSVATGPRLKLGRAELELPLTAGRETSNLLGMTHWSSGASDLSLALGPRDRLRLETRISSRSDTLSIRTRRTTALSWRHAFTEQWAVRAGLRQSREQDMGGDQGLQTESFAGLNATLHSGWRWDLQGSLSANARRDADGLTAATGRSTSLTLTGSKFISERWRLSGTLSTSQSQTPGVGPTIHSHSGGIRLQRDF